MSAASLWTYSLYALGVVFFSQKQNSIPEHYYEDMRAKQKEGQRKLTAELLRQLLSYDPATGRFTRLVAVSGLAKVGDIAGTESGGGYVQICIDRVRYFAHRLAWLYMTGEWPKNEIDHINWVRNDNRWSNLRDVTRLQNRHNRRPVTTAAPNP